jgi:deoxyribonuclease V
MSPAGKRTPVSRRNFGTSARAAAGWPGDVDLPGELERLLAQIPHGRFTTYGHLARALGDVKAARWVGQYLLEHHHHRRCHCHRVVRLTGEPGLYIDGDPAAKLDKLSREGIAIREGLLDVTLAFDEFESPAPLASLMAFQLSVPQRLGLRPGGRLLRTVAGIDAAYSPGGEAVGAYVLVDADTQETVWSTTVTAPATFPYISGYLAFRELPLMLRAWQAACGAGHAADAVIIDGNGILHPRRAGIAACFGLLADVPTVGIGKKLLCGSADIKSARGEPAPVVHHDEVIGAAVKCRAASRPIYVSPGNRIDLDGAVQIVQRLFRDHRLPEPLHRADRLSKSAARMPQIAKRRSGRS